MRIPAQELPTVAPTGSPAAPMSISTAPWQAANERVAQGFAEIDKASMNNALMRAQLANEAAAKDAYTSQFAPAVRDLLYDPKTGYYGKQGRDAVDAYQSTVNQIEQLRQQAT